MKKLLFTLFLMIGAICGNAQTAKIYKDGTVVQTIDNIDSVRFSQETTTIDIPSYAFSVAADKKVVFSPGNLQYTQSTNTWAFAEHQYDFLGDANRTADNAVADKIDLFGWSANNTTAPFGVSISTDKTDYSGDFVDWGANTIDTDAPNTWRTLTNDEWTYLFQHTRWTMAKVNDVLGFMLLPDGFVAPAGLTVAVLGDGTISDTKFNFNESEYAGNVYTAAVFAQLESLGVVFLPCAGYRNGLNVVNVGSYGAYWSATPNVSDNAKYLGFSSQNAGTYDWSNRAGGRSVRLVQDVQAPAAGSPARTGGESTKEIKTKVVTVYQSGDKAHRFAEVDSVVVCPTVVLPLPAFSVSADKKVVFSSGNLQYTQSTNTWAFAEHQYDIIGDANVSGGALADKIDLFGWSAANTTAPFGINKSSDNTDYAGAFVDWGTNAIGTYAPNTWRTLTMDEWEYLLTTRANAADRMGVARINLNDAGSKFANGVILLPDDWTCPAGVTFKSGSAAEDSEAAYGAYQTFTLAQWQALEEAGAVFLPASGYWRPVDEYVRFLNRYGYVHTATTHDSLEAWNVTITPHRAAYTNWDDRKRRRPVRLVQDVQAPAAGSPARTGGESTKEIKTKVVTVYQSGDKAHRFAEVDSVVVCPTVVLPLPVFSVSADKKVVFSPGNLQYTQSTNTWAFAEQQYDIIGAANISGGTLADKIDLFGWSASNTTAPFGVSHSTDKTDYAGDFVDWGTNTIDTDAPNTWRTLTNDEWTYLFQHTRRTMAKVNDVLGFMLLPDGFVAPAGLTVAVLGDGNLSGTGFSFDESDYASNVYTADQFAQLESLGVVFLPCAGYRKGLNVVNVGSYGAYWSATPNVSDNAKYLSFSSQNAGTNDWGNRDGGQSVRLVQDIK